eukprot:gene5003-5119_t
MRPVVKSFFHADTFTFTYLVWHEATKDAVIIDPVRDFDPLRWSFGSTAFEEVLLAPCSAPVAAFAKQADLKVSTCPRSLAPPVLASLETHVHADHFSGAPLAKALWDCPVVVGNSMQKVAPSIPLPICESAPGASAFQRPLGSRPWVLDTWTPVFNFDGRWDTPDRFFACEPVAKLVCARS